MKGKRWIDFRCRNVGRKVHTTMGIQLRGTIVAPFPRSNLDLQTSTSTQLREQVPVRWTDGSRDYYARCYLNLDEPYD